MARGFESRYSKSGTIRQNEDRGGIQSGYATTINFLDPITFTGGYMVIATPGAQHVSGIFKGAKGVAGGRAFGGASWTGGTAVTEVEAAYEPVDDDVVFEIEANGVVPRTAKNSYANWALGTPAPYGYSGAYLDIATINAAATGRDLRIVDILNYVDTDNVYNNWGSTTTKVLVSFVRAGNKLVA